MALCIAFLPENLLDCLCLKLAQHSISVPFLTLMAYKMCFLGSCPHAVSLLFFFFFKQKQAALEALFWRWIVTILQYFRSLCFDGSVERKSSFSLPYFYLLCSNSATSQNPKSQSKGDMKTVTNVCKIFFLKKLPLRQFFLEGYLPLKKFLPFAYFSYLAQTLEEIILP